MTYKVLQECRTCASRSLEIVIDLGFHPLANNLVKINEKSESYPLRLIRCNDCTLIQLDTDISPTKMFEHYNWVTGTSPSTLRHLRTLVGYIRDSFQERPNSILEIGSNDGSLLKELASMSPNVLVGVDPAKNLVDTYTKPLIGESIFFTSKSATDLLQSYGEFDIIIARNVFSHIPSFVDAIAGVSSLMGRHSLFFMEFHWAREILNGLHYDSIYHEHTFYHSLKSVSDVLKTFNLRIYDVFDSPISGGSLVIVASKLEKVKTKRLLKKEQQEELAGTGLLSSWQSFASSSKRNLEKLRSFLHQNSFETVTAFGASARSSTVLNSIGDAASIIGSIGDNNPNKWGLFSPGVQIEIESVPKMLKRGPSLVVLFPFNFQAEIIDQLVSSGYRGKILRFLPDPPGVRSIHI